MLTTRLGWMGAVAYALPILEVALLTQLSERGANAMLVVLQILWVLALLAVLYRCIDGTRAFRAAVAEQQAQAAREAEEAQAAEERAALEAEAERTVADRQQDGGRRRPLRASAVRSSAGRRRSHR